MRRTARGRVEGTEEGPISPREMAARMGLDYDAIPEVLNIRRLQQVLGLASPSWIHRACQEGQLEAEPVDTGGTYTHWRITRDGGIRWAYGRSRGPSPRQGVMHMRHGRRPAAPAPKGATPKEKGVRRGRGVVTLG